MKKRSSHHRTAFPPGLAAGLAVIGFFLSACAAPSGGVAADAILIEDVTLVSPERANPLPHVSVLIREGRIARVGSGLVAGPGVRRIDGQGRFLIPGLIDSHVHVGATGLFGDDAIAAHPGLLDAYRSHLPRAYLAFGFTTLVDLDLAEQTLSWFNAAPLRPRLYHAGRGVRIAGGYMAQRPPTDRAAADAANLVYEAARAKTWPAILDPRQYTAARAVERVVAAGGICVKTFVEPGFGGAADWPVPRPETLDALRAETRRRGLPLVVHGNGVDGWRAALNAHADVIAHGLWHWPGDRLVTDPPPEALDVIRAAARAGIRVQPTLQAVYGGQSVFDRSLLDDPRLLEALPRAIVSYLRGDEALAAWRATAEEYRQAIAGLFGPTISEPARAMSLGSSRATATLRWMLAENVALVFGTDTPSNDGIGNPPGLNGRLELGRWADAGVPLARILRAATLDNAAAFGLSAELGTIQEGKRADLLLLGADPLVTLTAYDRIEMVILAGQPIVRASLLPRD